MTTFVAFELIFFSCLLFWAMCPRHGTSSGYRPTPLFRSWAGEFVPLLGIERDNVCYCVVVCVWLNGCLALQPLILYVAVTGGGNLSETPLTRMHPRY